MLYFDLIMLTEALNLFYFELGCVLCMLIALVFFVRKTAGPIV